MKRQLTIACATRHHNRRGIGARLAWLSALAMAELLVGGSGCTRPQGQLVEIPLSQLADTEPVETIVLGRARVPFDRPLPDHLIQDLSSEYVLVRITRPTDWAEIRGRFHLPEPRIPLDFDRGAIVGILAKVGERAEPGWPIRVLAVRTHSGVAWIEASFASGLYYPLRTAAYLELVYAPGLKQVGLVRINSRMFVLGSAFGLN